MLPTVSVEVISEVLSGAGDQEKIRASWEEMIKANPALFTCITEIAVRESLKEEIRGEMILRGAMLAWESLRVQDEIDEMNREWGVE